MSQTELLRPQMDNLHIELQQLQVENARIRDAWADTAAVTEAEHYKEETERLAAEVEELRQMLHESQESEARATRE